MKIRLEVYNTLKQKVVFLYHKLKLANPLIDTLSLALYKQASTRTTKKSLWNDLKETLCCSYKTLVVNLNRCALLALVILLRILRDNRQNVHWLKRTDSTDIPVCLNKNAKYHRTMYGLAEWGHSG